jgi:hypothetical protein
MAGTLAICIAIALLVLLGYRLSVLKLRLEHVASQNRQATTIRVECGQHETTDPDTVVIRVNCPRCGDLDLTSCMVRFMICQKLPHEMRYSFVCWRCDEDVVKPATPSIVLLLLVAGVRPEYVAVDEVLMMEMSEVLEALGTIATMPSHEIWHRLGVEPR